MMIITRAYAPGYIPVHRQLFITFEYLNQHRGSPGLPRVTNQPLVPHRRQLMCFKVQKPNGG
jgi:hypothetical protein